MRCLRPVLVPRNDSPGPVGQLGSKDERDRETPHSSNMHARNNVLNSLRTLNVSCAKRPDLTTYLRNLTRQLYKRTR